MEVGVCMLDGNVEVGLCMLDGGWCMYVGWQCEGWCLYVTMLSNSLYLLCFIDQTVAYM